MDHDILIREISRWIREPEMIRLVSLWLHAGIISERGEWDTPDEGIAQGSVVSPLFSNAYLHPLDEFAVENHYDYLRYSDNFILLAETKDRLYVVFEGIKSFIEDQMKLRLNDNPYPFKDVDQGFAFLGVYFKGAERRISFQKETKIFRKINWLTEKAHQNNVVQTMRRLNESIEGSRRYYAFINPADQFRSFDEHLLKRLKFLFSHFLFREMIATHEEAKSLLLNLEFYTGRSDDERKKIINALMLEIQSMAARQPGDESSPKPESAPEKTLPGEKKRQQARQSAYLRKISDQAEISVSNPGMFIGKTSGRLVIREQRKNLMEVPFHKVKNLSIHTNGVSMSSDVIYQCSEKSIPITFYTFTGQPCAVLQSPLHSMGSLSILQIRAYETEKAFSFVKKIITGKARNQMNLLKFYERSRKNGNDISHLIKGNKEKMESILKELDPLELQSNYTVTRDRLFSVEARISLYYWEVMKALVTPELGFTSRNRYQAKDLVNSMLNYGYGILYQRVWQAVSRTGLNPHISFLHAFQPNKPTLVYDLVEEFRQPFIDRSVFSLLTKGKRGADFKQDPKTGLLTKETRDEVVKAVLGRLNGLNNYRGSKIKGEDIIKKQIDDVAAYLREDKTYRPFISGY